jgi:hypothetical protein
MSIVQLQAGNIFTLEGADTDYMDEWPAYVVEQNKRKFVFEITIGLFRMSLNAYPRPLLIGSQHYV